MEIFDQIQRVYCNLGAYENALAVPDILGCMDPLATNFDSTANINDSSMCTYCYATADFGTDSIEACDSLLIMFHHLSQVIILGVLQPSYWFCSTTTKSRCSSI